MELFGSNFMLHQIEQYIVVTITLFQSLFNASTEDFPSSKF